MSAWEAIYFGVAAFFCLITWLSNACSDDDESGLWNGLTWPVWSAIGLICAVCAAIQYYRERREDRP